MSHPFGLLILSTMRLQVIRHGHRQNVKDITISHVAAPFSGVRNVASLQRAGS
ncbi:MAG: hypothetical protein LUQ22_03735 [Methanotrichaceae archaeon]|nr:hypothetical protein [Methanotrichaceae archaeon]